MSVIFPAAAAARLEEKQKAKRQNGKAKRKRGNLMRALMSAFPLFIIPVGIYCLIAFTTGGDPVEMTQGADILSSKASPLMAILGEKLFAIGMMGGFANLVNSKQMGSTMGLANLASQSRNPF